MTSHIPGLRASRPTRADGRALLAAAALVTLAGAAAGCTAGGTSAAAPPTTSQTSASAALTATVSATADASAAVSSGSGTQSAAVAQCSAADLSIKTGTDQAASGHSYVSLIFTNSGSSPCYLHGFPGAELTIGGGKLDASREGTAPAQVTLASGQSASALLDWEHFPQNGSGTVDTADCSGFGATALLITAPNQTTSTRLPPPADDTVCWGFEVGPVVPGTTGRA